MTVFGVVKMPPKQPYERRQYALDVRPYMARGETIEAGTARVYEKGEDPDVDYLPEMLYAFSHDPDKGLVAVRIQEGTDGTTYRCRIRWSTVEGGRYEAEIEFKVVEVV